MKIDKKTIIAIVLGVAALGVVLYQMRGLFMSSSPAPTQVTARAPKPTPPSPTAQGKAAAAPSGAMDMKMIMAGDYDVLVANLKEEDIDFSHRKFKNPMTPIIDESSSEKPVWSPLQATGAPVHLPGVEQLSEDDTIEGIVWNEAEPLALVNDQVVGVGEQLEDGAVVTSITQDTVRFSRNGNRYYLVLREE